MDQLQNVRRINTKTSTTPESSKTRSSPTFEQLLHVSDEFGQPQKKSVLSKVKEKAKKIKRSLSKKKRDQDNNNFQGDYDKEGDREEDREYHGGVPVSYRTEMSRAPFKETTLQKPRKVVPLVPTKVNHNGQGAEAPNQLQLTKPSLKSPNYDETVSEKTGPSYVNVSEAANNNKIASEVSFRKSKSTVSESSSSAWYNENSSRSSTTTSSWKQTWEKSLSMKEYFMQKLEPGEDAKALSNVITEAISPKKSSHGGGESTTMTTTGGVVEKVKEAVNSLLTVEEEKEEDEEEQIPQRTHDERVVISFPASPIPVSTNAHEYYNEEETQGRILQTN